MKNIAIIPARSGSKGLKNKNILNLKEKPLLAYSIIAARESELFDVVFVSTDSEQYAEIARAYGAEVPFLRSHNTAGDHSSSWDVVSEVIEQYQKRGERFDTVALLQPTSPLRTAEDIKEAYQQLEVNNADAVIGVCETEHSPLWCNTLESDRKMNTFIRTEVKNKPRQELETYYQINGAIYIIQTNLLEDISQLYDNCYAYIMPRERSVDIDSELDFKIAEVMLNHNSITKK